MCKFQHEMCIKKWPEPYSENAQVVLKSLCMKAHIGGRCSGYFSIPVRSVSSFVNSFAVYGVGNCLKRIEKRSQ